MLFKKKEVEESPVSDYPEYRTVHEAIKEKAIGSVLSSNSLSTGGIKCTTGIKIDGRHFGDVVVEGSSEAVCWVSPAATIRGSIVSPVVYVQGMVHGDIFADRIYIFSGAVVDGDTHAEEVVTKGSGTLRGRTFKTQPQEYRAKGAEISRKINGG